MNSEPFFMQTGNDVTLSTQDYWWLGGGFLLGELFFVLWCLYGRRTAYGTPIDWFFAKLFCLMGGLFISVTLYMLTEVVRNMESVHFAWTSAVLAFFALNYTIYALCKRRRKRE